MKIIALDEQVEETVAASGPERQGNLISVLGESQVKVRGAGKAMSVANKTGWRIFEGRGRMDTG